MKRLHLRPFLWAIVLLLAGAVSVVADRERLVDNREIVEKRLLIHAAAGRLPHREVPILLERIINIDYDYIKLPARTIGRNCYVSKGRSLEYRPGGKTYKSTCQIPVFKFGPDEQLPVARCFMDKGCINLWLVWFPPYEPQPPPSPVHKIRVHKTVICNLTDCSEVHSAAGFSFKLMQGTTVYGAPVVTSEEGYATFSYQAVAGSYGVCEELTAEQCRAGFSCFKTSVEVVVTGSSSYVVQVAVTNLFTHKAPVVRKHRVCVRKTILCNLTGCSEVHSAAGFSFKLMQGTTVCGTACTSSEGWAPFDCELASGKFELVEELTAEQSRAGFSWFQERMGIEITGGSADVVEVCVSNRFTHIVQPLPPAPPPPKPRKIRIFVPERVNRYEQDRQPYVERSEREILRFHAEVGPKPEVNVRSTNKIIFVKPRLERKPPGQPPRGIPHGNKGRWQPTWPTPDNRD